MRWKSREECTHLGTLHDGTRDRATQKQIYMPQEKRA